MHVFSHRSLPAPCRAGNHPYMSVCSSRDDIVSLAFELKFRAVIASEGGVGGKTVDSDVEVIFSGLPKISKRSQGRHANRSASNTIQGNEAKQGKNYTLVPMRTTKKGPRRVDLDLMSFRAFDSKYRQQSPTNNLWEHKKFLGAIIPALGLHRVVSRGCRSCQGGLFSHASGTLKNSRWGHEHVVEGGKRSHLLCRDCQIRYRVRLTKGDVEIGGVAELHKSRRRMDRLLCRVGIGFRAETEGAA